MKKIGLSCQGLILTYGIDRGLEICKRSGFDAVDYALDKHRLDDTVYGGSEDAFESHFYAIRKKAKELELEISQTHGRCETYVPNNDELTARTDRLNELDLRATSILGAPACVIHFPNSSACGKQPPELMHRLASELYDKALPFAEKYKVKIALESFGAARIKGARTRDFFADPTEFKHQYDRLNTQYKTVCIDTGHTHEVESFWVPPPEKMIRILGKDISILHLHDNAGHWDDHLLPGMGNIKWPAVFDALEDIGYSGVYNFELSIKFAGRMLEEYARFIGKYLREFVDCHGNMKA